MPLAAAVLDSLPYIDDEPTPEERAAAQSLINLDIENQQTNKQMIDHASLLSPLPKINFSPLIQAELERIEKNQNKQVRTNAIDLSRYESNELPNLDTCDRDALCTALRSVYISHSYLNNRKKNLASLDKFGKNVWLLGNAHLESMLRDLERDLAEKKTEIDICAFERKSTQEAVGGEIKGLEESWKRTMGRALETEIATENLR